MKISDKIKGKPYVAGVTAAVIIAVAAFAVKTVIAMVSRTVTSGFHADGSNWWMLPLGIISIVASGWLVRRVVKMPMEHSSERMLADLKSGNVLLPRRLTFAPLAVNVITLGFGGSAGAEGPIAYTGAAIGSRLARWCGLSQQQMAILLVCGAGAGIAAIFKAPLGGVFYVLEILQFALPVWGVVLLVTMCLIAGLGAYALGGMHADVVFTAFEHFDLKYYPAAILLGLVCGLFSVYYIRTGMYVRRRLEGIGNLFHRNLIAGIVLGLSLFLFPALYGEGYGVLGQVLNGDVGVMTRGTFAHGLTGTALCAAVLAGILVVKSFATYATNSGGGIAGDFAPSIFAGGMTGALFAMGAALIPGWEAIPAGDLVLMGGAAVMAGALQAPIMAIFIVVGLSETSQLLPPIALTAAISYFVAKIK